MTFQHAAGSDANLCFNLEMLINVKMSSAISFNNIVSAGTNKCMLLQTNKKYSDETLKEKMGYKLGYEPDPHAAGIDGAHVLILLLVFIAGIFIWGDFMGYQSSTVVRIPIKWQTEQGTLTSTQIGKTNHQRDSVIYAHYTYAVDGFQYMAITKLFGPTGQLSEDSAHTLLASFSPGAVKVWYDPDNPATSKLEEGIPHDWSWSIFNGLTASAIGLLSLAGWWFYAIHRKPKKSH